MAIWKVKNGGNLVNHRFRKMMTPQKFFSTIIYSSLANRMIKINAWVSFIVLPLADNITRVMNIGRMPKTGYDMWATLRSATSDGLRLKVNPLIGRINIPSSLYYKAHFSRQLNCWSLRCSWSIACRRCSNYIFILHWTLSFNLLDKDNCKPRWETLKVWNLARLIWETLRYVVAQSQFYLKCLLWYYFINQDKLNLKWQYKSRISNYVGTKRCYTITRSRPT